MGMCKNDYGYWVFLVRALGEENKHLFNRTEVVCFSKPFIDATKS